MGIQRAIGILLSFVTFYVLNSVAFAVPGWVKAEADPRVVKITDSFGSCTGNRISNDGHILTARHCLNACLVSKGYVEEINIYPEMGWRSPKLYKSKLDENSFCKVAIDGKEQMVQVLAASEAFMVPSEQSSLYNMDKELYFEYLNSGYFHNGDFAIIKSSEKTADCFQMSLSPAEPGAPVSYSGYPGATTGRPTGLDSDGESFLKAQGELIESIAQNSCVTKNTKVDRFKRLYDRPGLVLSTVDLQQSASGSLLVDQGGYGLALINSHVGFGSKTFSRYCAGSAVAVSVLEIMKDVQERYGNSLWKKFFSCSQTLKVSGI